MHQIRLDREGNSATIDLNQSFYPMHLVQQSAAKFKKIAKISVKEAKGRLLVSIKPNKGTEPKEAALHFCNFVLALKRELGQHA